MQPEGGGRAGVVVVVDVIDWLMKPGGQNVLVEIVCSTKECNIRTQQNSTDSRLLTCTHNCFSVSFRNAQDDQKKSICKTD